MVATAVQERTVAWENGCYSVKYLDPCDSEWQFSMDYDWRSDDDRAKRNHWTCAESPVGTLHWNHVRGIPDHGYHALFDHFGLDESDVSFDRAVAMSPADLVYIRRAKEVRDALAYKTIMNMRTGCRKGELADTFGKKP